MTDGVRLTQPGFENLDLWFATQTDADNWFDAVMDGVNTGNDDDVRAAYAAAKGRGYGGHFATVSSMPTAAHGAGFRRYSEIAAGAVGDMHTGQNGEVGRGSDTMVIT